METVATETTELLHNKTRGIRLQSLRDVAMTTMKQVINTMGGRVSRMSRDDTC